MCNCGDASVRQQSEKRTDKHQTFIKYWIKNSCKQKWNWQSNTDVCEKGTQAIQTKPKDSMMDAVYSSEGHLLVLILPARVESSMSCKTSTRVSQVTGCLPLPVSHSWRIFVLISSALSLCSRTMLSTWAPLSSSSRIMPNFVYCVPITWGILILFSWPGKFSSSCRVGRLPAAW